MKAKLGHLHKPDTTLTQDLIKAATVLGLPSSERYTHFSEHPLCDLALKSDIDPTSHFPYQVQLCKVLMLHPESCFLKVRDAHAKRDSRNWISVLTKFT